MDRDYRATEYLAHMDRSRRINLQLTEDEFSTLCDIFRAAESNIHEFRMNVLAEHNLPKMTEATRQSLLAQGDAELAKLKALRLRMVQQ